MLGHFLLHMCLHCNIDICHMTACRNADTGIGWLQNSFAWPASYMYTQPVHTGAYQLSAVQIWNYPKTAWWYLNAQSNAWGAYAVTDNDPVLK